MIDVGDIGLVSFSRDNCEEVVLLLMRKSVGDNVGTDSDEGAISSLGGGLDLKFKRLKLTDGLDTVVSVEVVSSGA